MFTQIKKVVTQIKYEKPLILNITNYVTMDFVANGLLSLGASPIMSKAVQEVEDLLQLAQVIVINLGTLDHDFVMHCENVCCIANQLKKPIVLDPVGAGASRYRTETSLYLIKNYQMAIIRGNASEIMALAGVSAFTKGVDSMEQSECAMESAQLLSMRYQVTVVVSGAIDLVVHVPHSCQFSYGSPLMPLITGTGCLLSAVIGAFHAVEGNSLAASKLATVFYGICGEKAAQKVQGPGSFKMRFLDELHLIPEGHDEKI